MGFDSARWNLAESSLSRVKINSEPFSIRWKATVHGYVPAEHERLVRRGQRIHADDMAEQRVSAIV